MTDYYKDEQQMTDEQIAELAPDWCTHYEMKELEKPIGLVVHFQDERYFTALFVEHKSLNLGRKLIHHGLSRGAKPIPRKKFDIREEWGGAFGFESVPFIDDDGDIFVEDGWMCEEKVILLAKHFKLTAEDLK